MKRRFVTPLTAVLFLAFFSGIFRHDRQERQHVRLGQQRAFACVRPVLVNNVPTASAVLIADRYALSAAHVLIESDTRPDTLQIQGKPVILYTAMNERVVNVDQVAIVHQGKSIKAKRILLHPSYLDSLTKGSCDLALIELAEPVQNIAFPRLNKTFDEVNSRVVGVGYGVSGRADRPERVQKKNSKLAGENVIDVVEGVRYGPHQTVLTCDFDHPTRTDCNKMGSAKPLKLEYTAGGGDSGGGLFRKRGKAWELVGICSQNGIDIAQFKKTGYYGQTMSWTRVAALQDWVVTHLP